MSDIILTNISRIRKGASFGSYHTNDMGTIRGRYTNEAPVKYLLKTIYKNTSVTSCTVIAVTTPEAQEAFSAFRKTVRGYCRRNNFQNLSIEKITFDKNFAAVIAEIIKTVDRGDRVYIDATGGFRDTIYLIMAAVRIMEYSGVKLEKAVYSNYGPPNNHIDDITDIYNMFDLINAANSFTSFGNSDELASFFSECSNSEIKRAIDVMSRFSDEVTLCRTSGLNELIKELNAILTSIQKIDTGADSEILFKGILGGVIREKFGAEDGKEINYLDVITWCLDNRMIQQAVTIYVEKIPEFLFGTKILSYNPLNVDTSSLPKNFDIYYNLLYNGFLKLTTDITLSPYPLGNLLLRLRNDRLDVYNELCSVRNINDLSIRDSLTQNERRGVMNLIRVKNAVFDEDNHKRSDEDIERKKRNDKLQAFAGSDIFEAKSTSTDAFVNELLKKKEYICLLQGEFTPNEPKVWEAADINAVEHLKRVLEQNNDKYSIGSEVNTEDMQSLLRQLIYVKRYIRNSLNHASEENRISDEYYEYFSAHGYNVDSELSVEEIGSVIRNAVNLIKKITL